MPRLQSRLAWMLAAFLLIAGPVFAGALTPLLTDSRPRSPANCPWHEIARTGLSNVSSRIVLTDIFAGPEIAWFTGSRVVGAPYGEPTSIKDTLRAFVSTQPEPLREVVARRSVDYILVCASENTVMLPGSRPDSNYRALQTGLDLPSWLRSVALVGDHAADLRLYEVIN